MDVKELIRFLKAIRLFVQNEYWRNRLDEVVKKLSGQQ